MEIPRRFTIAAANARILNPIGPGKLADLGAALRLRPGQTMLDLACGKGEALATWAKTYGISGTGVDLNEPFVADARARAEELGVADRVAFVHADASDYVSAEPVDVAACIGAAWIGGGPAGTLQLLERSLKPGGLAVLGEIYWREVPPTQQAVEGSLLTSADDARTLPELIELVQAEGWDVVEMVHADEDSWDRYVADEWRTIRDFLDAHPDDPIAPELRAELDTAPARYTRYQRRYLGWGVLVLKRR